MIQTPAFTWDVTQSRRRFYSPDLSKSVGYSDLHLFGPNEIPAGTLALLYSGRGVVISDWAAGPPVWTPDGRKFAFPQCYQTLFRQRFQRIVVADTVEETITVFKEKFSRLFLRTFDDNIIYGRDAAERILLLAFDTSSSIVKTRQAYQWEKMPTL